MRSPIWFVVAGLIVVAGFVCAGYYVAPAIGAMDAHLQRVPIPGSAVIDLEKAGVYEIFYERDGATPPTAPVGLNVSVSAEATSTPVHLVRPSYGSTYSISGRSGTVVFVLPIDQPGRYRIATSAPGVQAAVLTVGLGAMGDIFRLVGSAIGIVAVGAGAGLAIVLVTLRQRAKAKS